MNWRRFPQRRPPSLILPPLAPFPPGSLTLILRRGRFSLIICAAQKISTKTKTTTTTRGGGGGAAAAADANNKKEPRRK